MIHELAGAYWKCEDAHIIFNPVHTSKKNKENKFDTNIKKEYIEVFEEYLDYIKGESAKRLLADIQIIQIKNKKRFILNAFVFDKNDKLDLLALVKTLVELFNLGEEYKLNISICFNKLNKYTDDKTLDLIINTIFEDYKYDVFIYNKYF